MGLGMGNGGMESMDHGGTNACVAPRVPDAEWVVQRSLEKCPERVLCARQLGSLTSSSAHSPLTLLSLSLAHSRETVSEQQLECNEVRWFTC
jgi:hypothetical protein